MYVVLMTIYVLISLPITVRIWQRSPTPERDSMDILPPIVNDVFTGCLLFFLWWAFAFFIGLQKMLTQGID